MKINIRKELKTLITLIVSFSLTFSILINSIEESTDKEILSTDNNSKIITTYPIQTAKNIPQGIKYDNFKTTTTTTPVTTTTTITTTTKTTKVTSKSTKAKNDYGKKTYSVPNIPDFKSWTNFRRSVNKSSKQWRILTGNGTWTDNNGFRRIGNDYMGAMGSYYTRTLGDRFKIVTTKGEFTLTVCDFKDNRHTDSNNQYSIANNCIIEFYVDNNLAKSVKQSGTASTIPELSGKITKIIKL